MKRAFAQKTVVSGFLLAFTIVAHSLVFCADTAFFLSCRTDNDLYRVLQLNQIGCSRHDSPGLAIEKAPNGAPVLILADGYPGVATRIAPSALYKARQKNLRLYIEYPASLRSLPGGQPQPTQWERAVITSDRFGEGLRPMRIIAVPDCHYIPFRVDRRPWIVIAKVAGFDNAVFGIPTTAHPILFESPDGVLVATTKLSQFVSGRYAPLEAWPVIWRTILEWLNNGQPLPELRYEPAVHPRYARNQRVPPDVERQAVILGVDWYRSARLLVHQQWKRQWEEAANWPDRVAPAPRKAWPAGDGRWGILEGFNSRILYDGSQYARWYLRADCNSESAMAFALRSLLDNHEPDRQVARNLLDFVYFNSNLQQGPKANPESPSYGLLGWDTDATRTLVYYGDDNARAFLATMAAAGALQDGRWDEALLKGILGNFRTTGRRGFRGNRLEEKDLRASGWQSRFSDDRVNYAPHYESWLWATYLWLYDKTKYEPLLDRARTAISQTMLAYPDKWRWTNGIQQERARMILPLAWLIRVDDTPEHRKWLRLMASDLLDKQVECGAIREEIGATGGSYGPPKSNEDYGKNEATLLQKNGDPVCDLIYTMDFAFLALHEAQAATSDQYYRAAEDKLASFLCRIQAHSKTRPEFEGAWFRAFDYDRWDYWASNADVGWGAWAVEAGWSQAWIAGVLALRQKSASLWDLTATSRIARHFETYRNRMLSASLWPE